MYACWMCFVQCVCVFFFFWCCRIFFRFVSFFIISVICSHFFLFSFHSYFFLLLLKFFFMVLKFTLFSFPLQIKTSYTRNFFFSIIPHIKYEPKKKINKNEFCHIDTNVDNHQFIINIVIMFYGNNIGST